MITHYDDNHRKSKRAGEPPRGEEVYREPPPRHCAIRRASEPLLTFACGATGSRRASGPSVSSRRRRRQIALTARRLSLSSVSVSFRPKRFPLAVSGVQCDSIVQHWPGPLCAAGIQTCCRKLVAAGRLCVCPCALESSSMRTERETASQSPRNTE